MIMGRIGGVKYFDNLGCARGQIEYRLFLPHRGVGPRRAIHLAKMGQFDSRNGLGVTHGDVCDTDFTFSPYKRDIEKKPKTESHLTQVSRHRG